LAPLKARAGWAPTPATANANAKTAGNSTGDRLPVPRIREFTGRIRDSAEPAAKRRLDHRAYPLFACGDWAEPRADLDNFASSLVSITIVHYGDCYLGVGWTKRQEDADTRYRVMLDLIAGEGDGPVTLLDFGCGASHLYEYLRVQQRSNITYSGFDLSPRFLACSRRKFPDVTY
jgi:hypothetical protein